MNVDRSIKQVSPFFRKRVKYYLSRLFGTRLQKAKGLYYVTVNEHRFKRLILCDSYLAAEIEHHLDAFRESRYFPPLVARYEHEIWLEYAEGVQVRSVDEDFVLKIAEFYALVYGKASRLVRSAQSPYPGQLFQDLRFLLQIGVFTQDVYRDLQQAGEAIIPEEVWVGYDYTDPVLKNFLLRPDNNQICVVDVDGLAGNQLLGIGIAKACVRWLTPHQDLFFSSLANHGAPDIQRYFSFVELCFLAKWMKRAFFEHDWKVIDASHFERFLRRS